MSAQQYGPLRIVRSAAEAQVRMAWLLRARLAARKAFDAALAAPRKAAGFLGRAVQRLHLGGACNRRSSSACAAGKWTAERSPFTDTQSPAKVTAMDLPAKSISTAVQSSGRPGLSLHEGDSARGD